MKISNNNIYQFVFNYMPLCNNNDNILASVDYCLKMNIDKIQIIYETLEEERKYIINKYGYIDKETGKTTLSHKYIKQAIEEFNLLLQIDQEIPIIPIKLSQMQNNILTLQQISTLLFMIDDDTEKKENKKMLLTNEQIYSNAVNLQKSFKDYDNMLPAEIAFYLAQNSTILIKIATNLEKQKQDIINLYQTSDKELSPQVMDEINQQLSEILNKSVEVKLHLFHLEDLKNCKFTLAQMQSLTIMIDPSSEKKEDI